MFSITVEVLEVALLPLEFEGVVSFLHDVKTNAIIAKQMSSAFFIVLSILDRQKYKKNKTNDNNLLI